MFQIFGNKKTVLINDLNVYAPVEGKIIPIEQSSDSVFASKAMGDGFAIIPSQEIVRSPVAAEVILVADTKHAIGLRMKNGYEVLIHMGVDTVELKGEPFTIKVKVGDIVEGGQQLGSMDLALIKSHELATDVMVVFTNSAANQLTFEIESGMKKAGEIVTTLQMKKEQD
ncbi:MAG: PTS glucose transporter subunit IIA [Enterococcus sp.]